MLRTDGKFEIYVIEFRVKKPDPDSSYSNSWHRINFDSAWVPLKPRRKSGMNSAPVASAGRRLASMAYVLLKQHSVKKDEYLFRVVKKTVWQDSEVLWCG